MIQHSQKPVENVIVQKTGHMNQVDFNVAEPWMCCVLMRVVPTEVFAKVTAKGMFDCSDEILTFLFRSHQGYPLMSELYVLLS